MSSTRPGDYDYSIHRLDSQSVVNLADVDIRLAAVVLLASARYHNAFKTRRLRVTDGRRTMAEQERLVREGKSRSMNSAHLDGRAVDMAIIIDTRASWHLPFFQELDGFMQKAASDLGIDDGCLLWGGHWSTLRDGSHWQLMLPPILVS